MGLLRHFIQADLAEFEANDVRFRVIGNYKALEPSLVAMIENAIARTAHNSSTTVVVALNYGAQDVLTRATQMLARKVAAGELSPNPIRPEELGKQLETTSLPPLDVLIRTAVEQPT